MPEILHQRVPSDHDRGTAVGVESAHGPNPTVRPGRGWLDPVVRILLAAMPVIETETSMT